MSTGEKYLCVKCLKPSWLMCQRCGDNYCSIECQISDWRVHKMNCIQMPILVSVPTERSRINRSAQAAAPLAAQPQQDDQSGFMRNNDANVQDSYKNRFQEEAFGRSNFMNKTDAGHVQMESKEGRNETSLMQKPQRFDNNNSKMEGIEKQSGFMGNNNVSVQDSYKNRFQSRSEEADGRSHSMNKTDAGHGQTESNERQNVIKERRDDTPNNSLNNSVKANGLSNNLTINAQKSSSFTSDVHNVTLKPSTSSETTSKRIDNAPIGYNKSNGPKPKVVPWKTHFMPPPDTFFEAIVQFVDGSDPTLIWVTEKRCDLALNNLMMDINKTYNDKSPLAENVQVGDIVATPMDGLQYRSEVLNLDDGAGMATVRLIDYGNVINLPLSKLYAPIPIMRNLNACTFRVRIPRENVPLQLEDIINIGIMNFSSTNDGIFNVVMKSLTLDREQKTLPPTPPTTPQEKNFPNCGNDNQQQELNSKKIMVNDINFIQIQALNENIKLLVLDSSNVRNRCITVAHLANNSIAEQFQKGIVDLNKYCERNEGTRKGYAPSVNELCLAIFADDGCWYRAVCKDVGKNDSFSLFFIDYGNSSVVPQKNIMPMPDELMFPCYANECIVNDIPMTRADIFQKAVLEQPLITCKIVQGDNGQLVARILNLEALIGK